MPLTGLICHCDACRGNRALPVEDALRHAEERRGGRFPYELLKAMLACQQDRGTRISTTTLTTKCLRSEVLQRTEDYTNDPVRMYASFRGTMFHGQLEQHATDPHTVEEPRFHITLPGGHLFSGSPDLIDVRKGELYDYKFPVSLDTPIPTPMGWTTMGAVRPGEMVFGGDGKSYPVTEKRDWGALPSYVMRFRNGETVTAAAPHRWVVTVGNAKEAEYTTEELASLVGTKPLRIRLAGGLELPDADLPIDPYLLGAWLGDGAASSGVIAGKPCGRMWDVLGERGHTFSAPQKNTQRTVYGLRTQLRLNGLLGNKHVPDIYLRASYSQRLDLLRGLMDADGHWHLTRREANFTNTNKGLALAVAEMVASLGWRSSVYEGDSEGFGVTCHFYRVTFRSTENPFLARGEGWESPLHRAKSSCHYIDSITPCGDVEVACIGVDSPDETYLLSRSMIPTHNSKENPRFEYPWKDHVVQGQVNRWLCDNADYVEWNDRLYPLTIVGHDRLMGWYGADSPLVKAWDVNLNRERFVPVEWQGVWVVYMDDKGPKPLLCTKSIQVPKADGVGTKAARVADIWSDAQVEDFIINRYAEVREAFDRIETDPTDVPDIPDDFTAWRHPLCEWCAVKESCVSHFINSNQPQERAS